MPDFSQFEYLSFDCYGTLIDWETGILGYLRPLLQSKGCAAGDHQILDLYAEFEPREQSGPYRTYREVLASVVRDLANELHFEVTQSEAEGLAESLRNWQPFPDTVPALRSLESKYKLAILSNIDDDLFAFTAARLQIPFECVVTAQQARSYKPSPRNFEVLLRRCQISRFKLLHVAESLYHDVAPANLLGIATVWVNRRQNRPYAATKPAPVQPEVEVPDLGALATLVGLPR